MPAPVRDMRPTGGQAVIRPIGPHVTWPRSRPRCGGWLRWRYETGGSGRIESYADDSSIGAVTVQAGVRSAVGTPITVEGRVWGVISAGSSLAQPLPTDAEERLATKHAHASVVHVELDNLDVTCG
jgi:GAF domain-containing protein